ncbi:MAG: DUF1499 domain-containing protein [Cellvibrionaceae bacterium]
MNTLLWTQLTCLFLLVIISLTYRSQYLPFKFFATLFAVSTLVLLLAGIVTLVKVGIAYQQQEPLNLATACALLMAVVVIVATAMFVKKAATYPAIHDISSSTQNPPEFSHALSLRSLGDNPLDYNAKVIQQQKAAYPELESLKTTLPFAEAFEKAKVIAVAQGWSITHANEDDGYIEAVARSALFRFADNIVIRVSKAEEGSVIDVRSASRVGKSDLGVNAKRIKGYFLAYTQ